MKKIHYDISVKGRVQGVWFRKFTKDLAHRIGVSGAVRNQQDGSVFIQAEGTELVLKEFLDGLKIGPQFAKVTEVNFGPGEWKDFKNFAIIR